MSQNRIRCAPEVLSGRLLAQVTLIVALSVAATTCQAAVISGTLQSVEADPAGVVVLLRDGKPARIPLADKVQLTLDGKPTQLAQLPVGASVSVVTNASGQGTRVTVRSAASQPAVQREPRATTRRPTRPTAQGEWTQFRGPNRDNISTETGLLGSWPKGGPKLAWTTRALGSGYSSVALSGNLVLTMGTAGDQEAVFAMEVNTGEPKWKTDIGPIRRDGAGDGPRCTPTIDGDKVYALGAQGALVCLELKTGRGIWQKNILREYDASNIGWGISESVLIDGEKLICTPGGRNATVVALNKRTGETIWKSAVPGNPAAAYASPIVVEAAGVRQYVNFTHSAIVGVRASDGEFLWQDNGSANGTANCSTALAFDNYVFSASGYGTGGALVELSPSGDGVTARRVYKTNDMKNHHGGMVHLDGYIYGSNDPGLLVCMEAKTGKVVWQDRSVGKGSLTYADGHLYLRSENGPMALVEATPQGYREKGRFDQPQRSNHSSWAHPVVAQGKLFLRDMDVLLAYDVRK